MRPLLIRAILVATFLALASLAWPHRRPLTPLPSAAPALAPAPDTSNDAEPADPTARSAVTHSAAMALRHAGPNSTASSASPLSFEAEKNISSRLVHLKELGSLPNADAATLKLFRAYVRNPKEDWLVRRQALENLRPHLATLPEMDRARLLAGLPPRVVALAALSEKEILDEVVATSRQRRRPGSSAAKEVSLENWDSLPCPSRFEYAKLAAGVGFSEPYACDDSAPSKVGRALLFLKRLELSDGRGEVGKNLRRPYEFLAERSPKMIIVPDAGAMSAYYSHSKKEISLGPAFFSDWPGNSLSILIHEARHADEEAMGHGICVQGDIPTQMGGCDDYFTDSKVAGAYSYDVYFRLALADSGLVTPEDRERLRSATLSELSRRFNVLPPALASFQDLVAALDSEGRLKVLHPFLPVVENAPGVGPETFHSMSYDDASGGAILYGDDQARLWLPDLYQPFLSQSLPQGFGLTFATKGRIPGPNMYPFLVVKNQAGRLHYLSTDPREDGHRLTDYPVEQPAPAVRYFLGYNDIFYLLSQGGKLFRLNAFWPQGAAGFLPDVQGDYRHGTGGVLKDSLYLMHEDGRLFLRPLATSPQADHAPVGRNYRDPVLSYFQVQGGREYAEGVNGRMTIDEKGVLWYGQHGERPVSLPYPATFKGFTFTKRLDARKLTPSSGDASRVSAFIARCGVKQALVDPWLGRGVGLKSGRLVFEGKNGECLPFPAQRTRIRALRLGQDGGTTRSRPGLFFGSSYLDLQLEDEKWEALFPYEAVGGRPAVPGP